jgi:hypothetical protein
MPLTGAMLKIIISSILATLLKKIRKNRQFLKFKMNLDQFLKFFFKYQTQLTPIQLQRAKNLISSLIKITKINRQKLKLGKTVFFINPFDINKPFQEQVTLKFVNQDSSESLEEKLQTFDENLK